MPTIAQRFAENLERELARSPLSQEEIAARAEIHRTQISKLLKGDQLCRIDTLVKLAGALDTAPTKLLEGITWSPAATAKGQFEVSRARKR